MTALLDFSSGSKKNLKISYIVGIFPMPCIEQFIYYYLPERPQLLSKDVQPHITQLYIFKLEYSTKIQGKPKTTFHEVQTHEAIRKPSLMNYYYLPISHQTKVAFGGTIFRNIVSRKLW